MRLLILICNIFYFSISSCIPEQVHITLGEAYYFTLYTNHTALTNASLLVTCVTKLYCSDILLIYNEDSNELGEAHNNTIGYNSNISIIKESVVSNYTRFSHTFFLHDISPNILYSYWFLYDNNETTEKFYFKIPSIYPYESSKIVFFGDYDAQTHATNAHKFLTNISNTTQLGYYDAIIHAGDFAYNLQSNNGLLGDLFMNNIQTYASKIPYMVSPGNHENEFYGNFLNYRFHMPQYNSSRNNWYSFNLGLGHYIGINLDVAEVYNDDREMIEWLRADLELASLPENTQQRPWIIIFTHRPFYCSYGRDYDCWANFVQYQELEDLAYLYGVDLILGAHIHTYERGVAMFHGLPASCDAETNEKLTLVKNCSGMINIISGNVGNDYFNDDSQNSTIFEGTATKINVLSIGVLELVNKTHLNYKQIELTNLTTIDELYIQKKSKTDELVHMQIFYVAKRNVIIALFIITAIIVSMIIIASTILILNKKNQIKKQKVAGSNNVEKNHLVKDKETTIDDGL